MKLVFECIECGKRAVALKSSNGEMEKKIVYYANFAKTVDTPQTFLGDLKLEAFEQLHYKPGEKYSISVGEHSGIQIVPAREVVS